MKRAHFATASSIHLVKLYFQVPVMCSGASAFERPYINIMNNINLGLIHYIKRK